MLYLTEEKRVCDVPVLWLNQGDKLTGTSFDDVRAVEIPKYGQIRTESRVFRTSSSRHLTFPSRC